MRKALLGVVTAAIILSLGSVSAFAASPGNGRYFVDRDGDGICDNYGSGRGCGYGRGALLTSAKFH